MLTPALVIILVSAADARAPEMATVAASAAEALGPNASVIVREVAQLPSDADAEQLEEVLSATAIVELSWSDFAMRRRARLHAHVRIGWRDRELTFDPGDPAAERGYAVGFAVAALVPPQKPEGKSEPSHTPGPPPAWVNPAPRPSPRVAPRSFFAVDLVVKASSGVAGYAGGLGGELATRAFNPAGLSARLAVGARLGEIAPARASALTTWAGLGFSVPLLSRIATDGAATFELGLRADLLLLRHAFARSARGPDTVSRDSRWIPGVDLMAEGTLAVARDAAVVGAVGAEYAFGATRVFVGDSAVATVPRLRFVFELGLRARF